MKAKPDLRSMAEKIDDDRAALEAEADATIEGWRRIRYGRPERKPRRAPTPGTCDTCKRRTSRGRTRCGSCKEVK